MNMSDISNCLVLATITCLMAEINLRYSCLYLSMAQVLKQINIIGDSRRSMWTSWGALQDTPSRLIANFKEVDM